METTGELFPAGPSRSDSIAALAAALAKAQKAMKGAAKDSMNPHFKNKYADLAACWDACREPLATHGLSILQPVSAQGAAVTVTTILAHDSGEWISESLTMTAQQNTPQGIGSAITYGRRYGLCAMVGIAPEDDDGNAASSHTTQTAQAQQPTRQPEGYDAWWDEIAGVADNGITELRAAWQKSKPEYRDYTTKQRNAKWEALKARAEKVKPQEPVGA